MGGGGMRIPIPGGTKAGGGIGGLVIVILIIVLSQCLGGPGGTGGSPLPDDSLDTSRVDGGDSGRYANCETGADANEDADCARVAVENSLYDFWSDTLEPQSGVSFTPRGRADHVQRRGRHGLRPGDLSGRTVLLPGRPGHLSRHDVLRGRAAEPARRAGG